MPAQTVPISRDPARVVRVFISSTFRDMHAEREELIKRVFPHLRRLCEQRGVVWGEVDLRWGVTEEEARQGQILRVCLEEVDRCRPFFLGLLGERYGWVPQPADLDKDPEVLSRYPWVGQAVGEGCSVTALEIEHGLLRDPSAAGAAFFYLRDPAYLENLPEGARRADFQEEHEGARQKLTALKQRLRASGLPVCADYADPTTLGQRVLNDFTTLLDRLYPPQELLGPLPQETAAHRVFADSRLQGYVGREEYLDRLDGHAAGLSPPLVVFGDAGSGKSALLAAWLRRRRGEASEVRPRAVSFWRRVLRPLRPAGQHEQAAAFTLWHCVGATPQSTTWPGFVRRALAEFKEHFRLALDVPDQPVALRTAFRQGLALAAAQGQIVLVLDGLDQLEALGQEAPLSWLPRELPPQLRLILSTRPGPLLTELRQRRWPTLEVKPLRRTERERLVTAYLGSYRKHLGSRALRDISAAAQTANPLYLRTLLEELRVFGRHEEVPALIRHYLAARTAPELYAKVLARWEGDYDRDRPALVRDAMTLLWASRLGLAEAELLELLKAPGDPLPSALWSPMYLAADAFLVNRSGLLTLCHPEARAAVERAYLPDDKARWAAHRRLADYFRGRPWSPRTIGELPWQLAALPAWPEVVEVLTDAGFLEQAWATHAQEIKELWVRVETASPFRLVTASQPLRAAPGESPPAAWALAALLGDTGHLDEALELGAWLEGWERSAGNLARLQAGLGVRAVALAKRGDPSGAMDLLREQEEICRRLGDGAALAVCLGNQGVLLRDRGERADALAKHREAEEVCRTLGDWVGVAAALGNQGVLLLDREDAPGALELFRQQEALCRTQGDLAGLQASLGNQASILRAQGRLDKALELHGQEEALCRRLYDRAGLQTCLGNRARLLQQNADYDGALDLLREREAICRQDGYREGLAATLLQQAYLFGVGLRQAEYALPLAEESLRCAGADTTSPLAAEIGTLLAHLRSRASAG